MQDQKNERDKTTNASCCNMTEMPNPSIWGWVIGSGLVILYVTWLYYYFH